MIRPACATLAVLALSLPATAEEVRFNRDIRPILSNKCFFCHGPDENKRQAELRLDLRGGAVADRGGYAAIVPGDANASALVARVSHRDPGEVMPPPASKRERLTGKEVALLARWIEQGAPYEEYWALQPIADVTVPDSWQGNPIDYFIDAQLTKAGIDASPRADRATLVRRVYLDLIGLLPTPEERQTFLDDDRPDAWSRLVDRLLASGHYGERWGRHWLDGARYADSHGYSVDGPRDMWPFRDWVIQALNDDLPFDRFTIEQLAGDLLPEATKLSRVASAFHRNTLINQEGGSDPEQFRVESVIDRVNTTGTVWLGLTVGCAQCHTHKFDPITQREYYGLFAFFNNTEDANDEGPTVEVKEGEVFGSEPPENQRTGKLMVMRELAEHRPTYILTRGDFTRPDKSAGEVAPGVIQSVPPALQESAGRATRLELARWLVDPANPLTPRVTVNRIWMRYFGRGLVETEEDFGTQGSYSTHPELLDYLGRRFLEDGWSLKAMHRLIVTSNVYRRASNTRPDLAEIDPRNLLLARQNRLRLDAEIVRDAALSASGLLTPTIGGPGVYPPQPEGIYAFTQTQWTWITSTGPDRFRRGIYTFFYRTAPYPLLSTFDAPDFQTTCTRRMRSNTPLQALTIANDPAFFEIAQGLAARIIRDVPKSHENRLRHAFLLTLCRAPSGEEQRILETYLKRQAVEFSAHPPAAASLLNEELRSAGEPTAEAAALVMAARAILNTDNFITRE
jgi:hypothetical protein